MCAPEKQQLFLRALLVSDDFGRARKATAFSSCFLERDSPIPLFGPEESMTRRVTARLKDRPLKSEKTRANKQPQARCPTLIHILKRMEAMNNLTPEQRQQAVQAAAMQVNQQLMQDIMKKSIETCFSKCATSSVGFQNE